MLLANCEVLSYKDNIKYDDDAGSKPINPIAEIVGGNHTLLALRRIIFSCYDDDGEEKANLPHGMTKEILKEFMIVDVKVYLFPYERSKSLTPRIVSAICCVCSHHTPPVPTTSSSCPLCPPLPCSKCLLWIKNKPAPCQFF